jgi:AAA15 family ATPase/GTPase
MISDIRLRDFKNFQDTHLKVGPFTLVVGTNASGKSNIRDVFRLLHGIGRGYSLAEIIGGRFGAGGQAEWAQMRGAAR